MTLVRNYKIKITRTSPKGEITLQNRWKTNSKIIEIQDAAELQREIKQVEDNCWIFPKKWNQACFDVIYYFKAGKVDVINVTISKQHECKFAHLTPFLVHLGVSSESNEDLPG